MNIDILDVKGAVVRTFTGSVADEKKEKKPGEGDEDSEFAGSPPVKLPTRVAGVNRLPGTCATLARTCSKA